MAVVDIAGESLPARSCIADRRSRIGLARELSAYKDDYEAAVKTLVAAKRKGKPLPQPEPERAKTEVVNIMDALRSSISEGKKPKKPAARKTTHRKKVA